jgi:hypothetical protein
MSLRKNLKYPRAINMRDTTFSEVSNQFYSQTQQWTAEFLALQQLSDATEEIEALMDYISAFPEYEIDISFFEWCNSMQLFEQKQNEFVLSKKGSVFLELHRQLQQNIMA